MAGSSVVQIKVTGDASGAKAAFKDAESSASDFQGKMDAAASKFEAVGSKMADAGKSLSTKVTLPLVAAGGASFKMAADFQDSMGASEQIFGSASESMKKWANGLPSYYGIAKGEALSYTNNMGSLLKNMGGMTEEEAAKTSQKMTMLAGDLAAMYGGSTEQAVNALTSGLKGNTEMLDNYGISVTAASLKTKAMEMGISTGTEVLTDQQKQAAMLAIIMEQTGDAQGQAGREAEGASGQMRGFTTDVKNLATDIGAKLLPMGTQLIEKVRGIVDRFSSLSSSQQDVIIKVAALAAALGPVLYITGKVVSGAGAMVSAFGKVGKAVTMLGKAFKAASAFMAANPVILIILAIVALGVALFAAYQKFEGFRQVVDTVGRFLRDNFMAGLDAIRAWWDTNGQTIIDTAMTVWGAISSGAQTVWAILRSVFDALSGAITNYLVPAFGYLWAGIQGVWNGITTVINWAWRNVIQPIFDVLSWYINAVLLPVFNVLWLGVQAAWNVISTVINWAWRNVIQPVWDAIMWAIQKVLMPAFSALKDSVASAFNAAGNAISWAWNNIISPVFEAIKWSIAVVAGFIGDRVDDIKRFFETVGPRIGEVMGGVAEIIKSPFRSAFDAIKSLWNSTVGGFDFTVPDWVPGMGGKGFKIPTMHTGGVVTPGPGEGREVLRLLEVGEVVIPRGGAAPGASGRPVIVNVSSSADPHQIGRAVAWQLKTAGV